MLKEKALQKIQVDSQFQTDIYDFVQNGSENGIVNAVAGSGKTTTILKSLQFVDKNLDINFLAFNKSIVDNLRSKITKSVDVSTFHSLGYSSLLKYNSSKVDENKIKKIIYENLKRFKIPKKEENSFVYSVQKLVDFIRLNNCAGSIDKIYELIDKHGILINEQQIEYALEILRICNNQETVDFVDMLYRPVNEDIKMKKYDLVYVDESQDLSIIQQHLLKKILKPKARFIAVGDGFQSIYGFSGSDYESFNNLKNSPNTVELPLSICYRCAKSIVRLASEIVPHIQYHESANEGSVRNGYIREIQAGDWVVCRNTKPLFVLCLQLFEKRKKAYIKGHDFGNELISMITSTNTDNVVIATTKLNSTLDKYYDKLKSYGIANPENTSSYNNLLEKIDIIVDVIFNSVKTVKEGIKLVNEMFNEKSDEHRITLSTIHRSKGFEADRVFVLRKELMPNKFAVQDWELQQEKNLEYVCYTRAKNDLIFIVDFIEKTK